MKWIIGFLLLIGASAWGLDYGLPQKLEIPQREHSIIITDQGYFPNRISLFKGEKLKIFVTSLRNKPSCLFIPDKNLFIGVKKGEVRESEVIFNEQGSYSFFCPTGKIFGKITVLKKMDEEDKIQRMIASETPTHLWVPKDE
ncbi:MAG: cupredoxin domain-containing protein [Bdellovibrionales bacterium]|nr:cupredoxin domain-containing protein [Bdellovibrionales bacterium]